MKRLAIAALAVLTLGAVIAGAQVVTNPQIPPPTVCAYNASPPTLTSGQASWLQCDNTGKLITSTSGGGISAAVTVADGADVAEGSTTDAAATQGGTGTVSAKLRTVTSQLNTIATTGHPITGTVAVTQSTSPWVVSNSGTFATQATLAAETTKVIGTVNQGTSPWVVSGSLTTTPSGTQAISAASGAFASGSLASGSMVDLGSQADAVCGTATGTCSMIALAKFLNNAATSSIPAGTNIIGKVGIDQTTPGTTNGVQINAAIPAGTNVIGHVIVDTTSTTAVTQATAANLNATIVTPAADPCQSIAATYTPISITSATTTRIVAPTSAKKTYVCYLFMLSAIANNVAIVEGTGGTCGSSTAGVVGGTTAANGLNLAANSGAVFQAGGNAAIATAGTNVDLCLITSAAGPLAGHIKWVQAP